MKLHVAIIGTGYGLRVLSNCFKNLKSFDVKYIFSRNKKGLSFTNNINQIIQDKTVNFICIETPPFTHLKFIKLFIKKKKHIFYAKNQL